MRNVFLGAAALLLLGSLAAFSKLSTPALEAPAGTSEDFKSFLKQFPRTELPYTLSKEDLQAQLTQSLKVEQGEPDDRYLARPHTMLEDPNQFIPRDRSEMMSRVPIYLSPEAQLATADNYAVIYTATQGFSRAFKSYHVVVFDKKGRFISKNFIAGIGTQGITAGSIDKNLHARVGTYIVNWENDIYETGIEGNKITSLDLDSQDDINLKTPTRDEDTFRKKLKTSPRPTVENKPLEPSKAK